MKKPADLARGRLHKAASDLRATQACSSGRHAAFALAILVFGLSDMQVADAVSSPKPPGIRSAYTLTLLLDGTSLLAGGYVRGSDPKNQADYPTNEALIYQPTTGPWTNTGNMTTQRLWHAATLLSNGKVLVSGGAFEKALATAELYDPATRKWKPTGAMSQARSSHTATLLPDGTVLVSGGTSNRLLSSAELYNPTTERWTNTAPMKFARTGHTATLLTNGLVLIAGGWDESHNFRSSAELYEPSTGKWRMTGEMPYGSRFFYTAELRTNGLVLLTATDTNAWENSQELYDPASETWQAIGPKRPHFVSSTNLDRTLTIQPGTGSSFLASQEIQLLIESADQFGVTNISLFLDNAKVAESEDSPMRFTITNAAAGAYVFVAKAAYANGLASTSSPVNIVFEATGPEVFLAPGPTEFISTPHVHSSPAILLAAVVGVNPDSLTNLTLNGEAQPLRTGNFVLHPRLAEGENVFLLVAKDKQGRTAQAETKVYLDSRAPTISITDPTNNTSLNVMRVGVRGTFAEKSLKQITVNGMPAFIRSNTFEVLNVFLEVGTNIITGVAEDDGGNVTSNSIVILGPTDTNAYGVDPVQLIADQVGGFAPLEVTFKVQARVPGDIKRVLYDFDGDHAIDRAATDLQPVKVTFAEPGDRFPVVTLETTVGRFSSASSRDWFFRPMRVSVSASPILVRELKVEDPVDLQCTEQGHLYVLSRKSATVTEFDAAGKVVRAIARIGSGPQGLCVDDAGNVYVAMTGDNQIWKFKPTTNSFEPDKSFSVSGYVGNIHNNPGTNTGEFDRPFDVAIMRESSPRRLSSTIEAVWVSDAGNHRIQKFTSTGEFLESFGRKGTNLFEFDSPKGMFCDGIATICVVDSGNNRILECYDLGPIASSGHAGTALGEFRGALNVCLSERGICIADTGNGRIQLCDPGVQWHSSRLSPFNPRLAISNELSLKQPSAVAWLADLLEDRLYIADTGNNRVILVKLPADNPDSVWTGMKQRLLNGDIEGAVFYFASSEAEKYRRSYQAIGTNELIKIASELPAIKPVVIKHDTAQYRFDQLVDGQLLTFSIEFVRENGKWKIVEY